MTSSEEKADIKTASYKFNTNLLKLSVSDDIEEAKTEWEFITSLKKEDTNNLCICQHKVKHINYFLNRQNQNTIICGSKCCKKIKFEAQEMKSKRLSQLLINNLRKGEYEQINNILIYSENVKQQLIKIFQNEYEINKNDINKLKKLLEEIEELIDYYKFECLLVLKNSILETINEQQQQEQLIKEQQRKEEEKQRIERNKIEQQRKDEEKKILEQSKIEQNKIEQQRKDKEKQRIEELRTILDEEQQIKILESKHKIKIDSKYIKNILSLRKYYLENKNKNCTIEGLQYFINCSMLDSKTPKCYFNIIIN